MKMCTDHLKSGFRLATLLSSAGRAQDCNCSTSNRYLEARGSIPRGETFLLLLALRYIDIVLWGPGCIDFGRNSIFERAFGCVCLSLRMWGYDDVYNVRARGFTVLDMMGVSVRGK